MSFRLSETLTAITVSLLLLFFSSQAWGADVVETVALLRHGEKPAQGLGQLDCQGLNRALALPAVIAKLFGEPSAIFAPNPSQQKIDNGVPYDYVRPLATIEPTAIFFELPVNAAFGVFNTSELTAAVEQPRYHNEVVLIAWEHKIIETIARALLAAHGADGAQVPEWDDRDFDSIYVVTITRTGDVAKVSFAHEHEGLNGQPNVCPR